MIVLGLDPGIARCGYGVVRHAHGTVEHVRSGVVTTTPKDTTATRLLIIDNALSSIFKEYAPDTVVIERLIPGPNRNLGVVSEVRGVLLLLIAQAGIPYSEESPKAVKLLTTRYGSATKMQMRRTIQKLLSMDTLPAADAADALALALLGRSGFSQKLSG